MIVATSADLRERDGHKCTITGEYREIDIRMRPKGPPQLIGYAAVVLRDGAHVLLEPSWSPAAVRPDAERRAMAGRRVRVVGVVHVTSPKPADGSNYLTGPCISPVDSVQLEP